MTDIGKSVLFLLFLVSILHVVQSAPAACGPPTGYDFNQTLLSGNYILSWTVNQAEGTISFGATAATTGWVGFGIAAQIPATMVPSEATVGWAGSSPTIHSYRLVAQDQTQFVNLDNVLNITNTNICYYTQGSTTWTSFEWTRPIQAGNNKINIGNETGVVAAFGLVPALVQHALGDMVPFSINFQSGVVTPTGISSQQIYTLEIAHGFLMFIAYGLTLPIGAFVARFGKQSIGPAWITVHMTLQTLGWLISIAGLAIALVMANHSYFKTQAHGQLGISVIVAAFVQILIGAFRPHFDPKHPENKTTARRIFEVIHPWFGRIILLVASITIFFGLNQFGATIGWWIGYAIIVGLLIGTFIALQFRFSQAENNEQNGKAKLTNGSEDE